MKPAVITLFILLLMASCGKMMEEDSGLKSKVTIQLPSSNKSLGGRNLAAAFATLDDITCYAITVSWPNTTNLGKCLDTGANPVINNVGEAYGLYAAGSIIELDVSSGPARTISIVGIQSTNGLCEGDIKTLTIAQRNNLGQAIKVGSVTKDLVAEIEDITIDISMTGSVALDGGCEGAPFAWEQEITGVWDQSNWDQSNWGP